MPLAEIMTELEALGDERTRRTLAKHGAPKQLFGVKVADLKQIVKREKKNHALALALYETGNGDAQYLAGLLADPKVVTERTLDHWVDTCSWHMVGEYMVAGLAAESPHGWSCGLRWIEDDRDLASATGWNTLSGVVSIKADEELDLQTLEQLLHRIASEMVDADNRTRYTMNGFVIAVGCYVLPLVEHARQVAAALGKVEVDMGATACKVPYAPDYIEKVHAGGRAGKKRKKVRC